MSDILNSIDDEKQPSIMVPIGDLDTAEHSPDTVDELAMELATIKQPAKRIAIIGSRNLAITHQQMIETLDRGIQLLHPEGLAVQMLQLSAAQ